MKLLRFFILTTLILVHGSITLSAQVAPNSIPGLKLWLTGDSTHKSTTTDIDICYDLSGLNNHATQTTFSSQPQDAGITLNGHKTIRFDGFDDYFNFNVISDIRTVFWVIKESPTAGAFGQPLLGHSAPPYSVYHFHRGANGGGVSTKELWSTNNASADVLNGTTMVNSNVVNGTTYSLIPNFSLISLVTTGNVEADNFSSDRYLYFPNAAGPRFWDGDLAELIIYNQALTPAQVTQIEQYLYNKYSKPINLGPDQITCNFPITLKAKKDFILNYTWQDNSTDDSLVVNSPGTYYITTTDVFGKISSDTINVIQGPFTYSVVLGNDTTICNGQQVTLNAGPDYLNYLWSNGATSHSITVNSQATYSVSVTDCSGNITIDSIKVTVQALPTFNFGPDRPICYNVGYILDPGFTNTLSLTFNWSDNTHNNTHPVTISGTYSLEVIDNLGCTFSDAVNLQIDSSLSNLSLGPNISFCAGNSITLTSGMSPSLTYTWSDGSHNDSLMINTTGIGQYSVVVTNTNNCVNSDTIDVTVFGQAPTANFSASIGCLNNAVTFTNLSSPPLGNTITVSDWNFGDPSSGTNTSTLTNPAHTYTAIGAYTVTLKVTTDATCEQTIIQTITISPSPTVNFSVGIPCQNNNTAFTNQSISSGGYSITSLSWNFGDPISGTSNVSGLSSPSHVFNNQTSYSVSLVAINSGGCKDSLTKIVTVIPCNITPNDISGIKLWFTGDSIHHATVTDIDTCYDLSGSNNNGVQLLSINQPKDNGVMLNGHKTMSFDGADDYLQFNAISDIRTVFWVIKENALAPTDGQFLLGHSSSYNFHRGYNINPTKAIWSAANASVAITSGTTSVNSNTVNGTTFNVPTNFSIISLVTTGNVEADNFSKDRSVPLRYWDGNLAELIIYNQALTPTQVIQVEQYLHQKYTKPVDLGPDRMVCTFPMTLKAKKDYLLNYLWQNASTADSLVVNGPGTYYVTTTDVFNKITSDTIVISLSPPNYTVALGNDTTICSGQQLVLNAGPDNLNYLWSTSSTSHSISINIGGTYSVSVTDCSGNITTDIINVTVQTPPAFNFGSKDTIICSNSNFALDPGFGTSSPFTFHWQDNANTSSYSVSVNGQYYLDVTDNIGCKSSDTVNIQIDNSLNSLSLGPDTQLCSGNLITLTQGANPSLTYAWNSGSSNDSLLITNTGQYSVIVTNTNNCVAKDTIIVTIQGFAPTANFSSNIGCANQIVSFTDLSIPPSGNTISNYAWSFGDTTSPTNTSTAANPSHTYTNTGTYTINLTVTTNTGCTQSITKIINVYPVPTATFSFGTSCQNDSTSFLNQSTGITGYSITSSYWNFGDFPIPTYTSNVTSPKHVFTNLLTYSVTLVVTNSAGCKSSVTKALTPKYEVTANFTNGPACANNATNFQSTSIIPPSGSTTYSWTFPGSTATVANPIKTFTNSGVYNVTLIVDGNNGCTSSITKLVNVYLPPIASFSIPSFCAKDTVNVINLSNPQSGIISSYNWRLNNITFSTVQSPTLSLTNPGNNSVRLTTINSFGCKDSTTNSFTTFPLPVVDFSTTPVAFYYINEPINYTPSITNASSYLWNMDGTSTYSIQSPTETFNTEGSFIVSLNLRDQNGCKGSKTKNITVSKRYLDLAILNLNTSKDNNGFMTVVADIANYGSVPINSFKMGYQISDGGSIKETWNGNLNPNSFYTYTFNAVSASLQNSNNNITCVEIENVNTIIDDNTTNNYFCSSLNTDDIYVANPLPNPTDGDIILPITLNRDIDYTIAIYNSIGQIQYEETTKKGIEGLNFVTLNTSSYARGCYIIKVIINEEIIIKKFIKIDS